MNIAYKNLKVCTKVLSTFVTINYLLLHAEVTLNM